MMVDHGSQVNPMMVDPASRRTPTMDSRQQTSVEGGNRSVEMIESRGPSTPITSFEMATMIEGMEAQLQSSQASICEIIFQLNVDGCKI